METLTISRENARLAFIKADYAGKRLLADLLGEQNLIGTPWKVITSIEVACEAMGFDPQDPRFTQGTSDQNAYHLLTLAIVPALQEGRKPDWNDDNERKWWASFWMDEEGGGFRFYDMYYAYRLTGWTGGSRLCLPDEERVLHMVKYFLPVLRDFYC